MLLARVRAYPDLEADLDGTASSTGPPADPVAVRAAVEQAASGGRIALLAYGANRSAAVLAAKLGAASRGVVTAAARLRGFDVVFSAHVAPYGAIPATLWPSEATTVEVSVLLCAPESLRGLDATEPNYVRRVLEAPLELPGGPPLGRTEAYVSRHGCLRLGGAPVALAAVAAEGRRLRSLTEAEVLEEVRRRLDPGADPDAWVLAGVRERRVREARTRRLRADAIAPCRWKRRPTGV